MQPIRRYLRHGTLPQLAAFEAVLRLGSVTEAAEALHMAQPTLSGHLRKLGEALDVRLFERRGKHLVPTAEARLLAATAREVFEALARCEALLGPRRLAAAEAVTPQIQRSGGRVVALADERRGRAACRPAA
ncbi:MAG: LysR family transcriptional regulator [Burkholderiales bacterium]